MSPPTIWRKFTPMSVSRHFLLQAPQSVSLFRAKMVQQSALLSREIETRLLDCGVAHYVKIDHLSRLPVMTPSIFDVSWLQVQSQRLPGCQSQKWSVKDITMHVTDMDKINTVSSQAVFEVSSFSTDTRYARSLSHHLSIASGHKLEAIKSGVS